VSQSFGYIPKSGIDGSNGRSMNRQVLYMDYPQSVAYKCHVITVTNLAPFGAKDS
jgi:hypothetical protein